MDSYRPTHVEIDLHTLRQNIFEIRKILSPGTRLMAIVKADAYGHGAVEIAKAAEMAHADYFGVATLGEALELRTAAVKLPILILSESPPAYLNSIIDGEITQTVYTFEFAKLLSETAKRNGVEAAVHIKIDTGMGRVGVLSEIALPLIIKIASLPNLVIEGVFTHFAKADDASSDFTMSQFNKFMNVVAAVRAEGIQIPLVHAANSAAMLCFPRMHLDMVRVGICMYGLKPVERGFFDVHLNPVLCFKTKVVYMKEVPAATPIGYGTTFYTKKTTQIATLPVGYADGISRRLSNRGSVIIKGKRFPIVGTVTMDMTMVDVGNSKIAIGDDAVIIGGQMGEMMSAAELAALDETIPYEVLCGIGKRVPKIYLPCKETRRLQTLAYPDTMHREIVQDVTVPGI